MALGDGTGWDITAPNGDNDDFRNGDDEIRDLRVGVAIRSDKEHVALADSSAGGEHKEGSAKVYRQATAPTQRPDAATTLAAADDGRIWVDSDDDTLYLYEGGTGWVALALPAANLATDAVETDKIKDDAVDNDKLADDAVDTDQLADGAVDADRLATDAVETDKILDDAVTTAKILDANVTAAKLAAGVRAQVETGTYAGDNDNTGRVISTGFSPSIVIVWEQNDHVDDEIYFKTNQDATAVKQTNGGYKTDVITALGENSFTLGSNVMKINETGKNYTYIAVSVTT